ncbi:2-hydroxyacid dehydrogenase [Lysinibacter cavernae]|uniref:Phosphoglycerate dehydrogenase-like enzyme n=1 Tax=Lysinibacter cavernae TaxID=1640652 RepID=A0A7X5R1P7_9MICO|nr:2-hydroxyacid dehydrogenase [Lysinibacter cavernae]NIH54033.1 phosphoglycerate dehydrogenase-like enzyme [Lysinibacter cavernae]
MAKLTVSVPGKTLLNLVSPAPEGVEYVLWDLDSPAPASHIDIVVPPYMGATPKLKALDGITTQLVQSQSIGYDGVSDVLSAGHRFANASSVHEASTAELTLALILALQRGIPDFVHAQAAGKWAPQRLKSLADSRVLIVGYGGVGKAIEDRLIPFEVTIDRLARTARDTEHGPVHAMTELHNFIGTADIVILAMPLTPQSEGLVDDAFLSSMAEGAMLVNIARGPVVNTDALVEHLGRGRLRAALDVTDPEPLPEGHPLWSSPNLLISPHVGGASSAMMPRMAALLRRQIDHLLKGEEPENVVIG